MTFLFCPDLVVLPVPPPASAGIPELRLGCRRVQASEAAAQAHPEPHSDGLPCGAEIASLSSEPRGRGGRAPRHRSFRNWLRPAAHLEDVFRFLHALSSVLQLVCGCLLLIVMGLHVNLTEADRCGQAARRPRQRIPAGGLAGR